MSGVNHVIDEIQTKLGAGDLGAAYDLLEVLRPKTERVEAVAIFGRKTKQPYVELHLGDIGVTQWSPAEARHHAMAVLEVAEAAEQDAFIYEWFAGRYSLDERHVSILLQEYRAFRAAQRERNA